jgi:hypothetical protein
MHPLGLLRSILLYRIAIAPRALSASSSLRKAAVAAAEAARESLYINS